MSAKRTTIDHTKLVLAGYIRDIQSKLSSLESNLLCIIPASVINVVLLYLKDLFMNHGVYTWCITDPIMVRKILDAETGEKFTSDPFKIARLTCQIEIYPNGDKEEICGWFVIHLKLLSLPKYIKHVTWTRIFQVLECRAGAPFTWHGNIEHHDLWTRKCHLGHLIELNPNTITVQVEMIINKIVLNDTSTLDNILWTHGGLLPHPLSMYDHIEINLDESDMKIFKTKILSVCTKIINDIWSITIYPSCGYFAVFLKICQWPVELQEFVISYKLNANIPDLIYYGKQKVVIGDADIYLFKLYRRLFRFDVLHKYQTMNLRIDIELSGLVKLKEIAAEDGGVITDPVLIAFLLSPALHA